MKIIKWVPLFKDAVSRTIRRKGLLVYILVDNVKVHDVGDDPLTVNAHYGESRSMLEELINSLPHVGPIFLMIIKLSS